MEWKNILIFILAIVLLICGIILSFKRQTGSATVTYAAAILCLIFSSLHNFEWFKGLGIEAKVDKKIKEADDTIKRLKEMAIPFSELLLTQTARSGRWVTTIKRRERYRLAKDIEKPLLSLGVTKEELEKIKKDWYKFDLFDLCFPIRENLQKNLESKIQEKHKQISAIPQPIAGDNIQKHKKLCEDLRELGKYKKDLEEIMHQDNLHTSYQDYIDFINNCPAFDTQEKKKLFEDNDDSIKDLKYYCENHDFRRPEYWFKNDDN